MALVKRAARMVTSLLNRTFFVKKNYSEASEHDQAEEAEEHFTLEEKSAIINGGASGIGFEIAREFLKRGINHQSPTLQSIKPNYDFLGVPNLSIIDIDETKGEKALKLLTNEFGNEKVLFFEADAADALALDDVYRKCIQFHDVPEIVVNSAGIMNDTQWNKQICTNMSG